MTWSRFDDAAARHPKAMAAGNEAWSLWVGAVMYCNRFLTDGAISLAALMTECLPEPMTMAKARKLAERLVEAGLLVRDDARKDTFHVHDFLEWNPSKQEVESKRKADRDRKRRPPESGGSPGGHPGGIPPGSAARIPDGKLSDGGVDSGSSRVSARALPAIPAQPFPAQPVAEPAPGVLHSVRKVRERGARPVVHAGLLPAKISPREFTDLDEFRAYGTELGLSAKDFESALADFCEKVQPGTAPWLADKLCRFLENAKRPDSEAPAPRRPPPVIVRDYVPEPLPDIPAEVLAQISPARPLLRPVKSREQQIAELQATLGEDASAGRVEPEAGNG